MTTDSEDCFAIPTNTSLKYVRNGALNIRHRLSGVLSPLIRKAVFKIEDIKGCGKINLIFKLQCLPLSTICIWVL